MELDDKIIKVEKVISLLDKRITKILLKEEIDDSLLDTLTDIRIDYNEELKGLNHLKGIRRTFKNYTG